MNKFETMVMDIYMKEHAKELAKEVREVALDFSDIADPSETYQHEIAVKALYRVTYLAVSEYHKALTKTLKKHDIALPSLEELFED